MRLFLLVITSFLSNLIKNTLRQFTTIFNHNYFSFCESVIGSPRFKEHLALMTASQQSHSFFYRNEIKNNRAAPYNVGLPGVSVLIFLNDRKQGVIWAQFFVSAYDLNIQSSLLILIIGLRYTQLWIKYKDSYFR